MDQSTLATCMLSGLTAAAEQNLGAKQFRGKSCRIFCKNTVSSKQKKENCCARKNVVGLVKVLYQVSRINERVRTKKCWMS